MNKTIPACFMTLCLAFITCPSMLSHSMIATPEERTVGVTVGASFLYDVSYSWRSNASNPQPEFPWAEGLSSYIITIVNIEDVLINYFASIFFKNGSSEGPAASTLDIETGEDQLLFLWTFGCISADLSEGDLVYTSDVLRINETIVWTYPEENRSTNHVYLMHQDAPSGYNKTETIDLYWDKLTGVLVELSIYDFEEVAGEYTEEESLSYYLVDTNLWVVPEFPSFFVLPLLTISTLLVVMVYRRKHSMWMRSN